MADKKYTAKQLRLTNEEIVEKFAIYWAEVDSVAKRQQSSDKILEANIVAYDKLRKQHNDLQKQFDILILLFILMVSVTWVWFWLVTW